MDPNHNRGGPSNHDNWRSRDDWRSNRGTNWRQQGRQGFQPRYGRRFRRWISRCYDSRAYTVDDGYVLEVEGDDMNQEERSLEAQGYVYVNDWTEEDIGLERVTRGITGRHGRKPSLLNVAREACSPACGFDLCA